MTNEKQYVSEHTSEKKASKAKHAENKKPDRVFVEKVLKLYDEPAKMDAIFDSIEKQNQKYTLADFLNDERIQNIVNNQRARGISDLTIKQGIEQTFSISISTRKWREAFPVEQKKSRKGERIEKPIEPWKESQKLVVEKTTSNDLSLED